METVSEYFGSLVFDDRVMKASLPAKVYQSLRKTIDEGAQLDISVSKCGCNSDERLGGCPWRNPLYPLVPAINRHHSGKSMTVLYHRHRMAA